MTTLREPYRFLLALPLPRIITEALKHLGLREVPGPANAPEIMRWARDLHLDYQADAVPWCGLFAAKVVSDAGWVPVDNPLWARNWARFGQPSVEPGLGDVLVFQRATGGHVGFYVGEDATAFHVLGGNQGDSVSIIRVEKNRLLTARRPIWRIEQPASVKPYHLTAVGVVSENEA